MSSALGVTHYPRMDVSQWKVHSDVLACELSQDIPAFGRAVFDRRAGGNLAFYLYTSSNPFEQGRAALQSLPPTWNPNMSKVDYGFIETRAGDHPVLLDNRRSAALLAELYDGRAPQFLRRSWYKDEEAVKVKLSPATFRSAYDEYMRCLAQLAPVGFDKLERSRINFASDSPDLTEEAKAWLSILAAYINSATNVSKLYIDGHTDNTHLSTYNIKLSQQRAESTRDYLKILGVPSEKLVIRFHGERFPVKSNLTPTGRKYNRRVTLRVELDSIQVGNTPTVASLPLTKSP